nr:RepB family plasmid replication initiator protein [Salinibacter ruber]
MAHVPDNSEDRGENSPGSKAVSARTSPSPSSAERPLAERESFDEEDIVVKANQLIRGRINWTKLEHRVVAMLVAQLKKEDESFEMQRVHISDLMDMAQVSSRDIYDRAEEVCRKLLNQKVHVRTSTDDGRRVYQGYNCLSTCRYVEGSGYIEAKFNDDMKPFLLQLKRQFTMYRLQNFMRLSSQHSMRMYELIKMREGLRHLCLSVEELREVLCCEHTYDRFSDFKRYVLERARTEIADTCDIYFTYKVERDGRTPVRVRLLIHQPDAPCTDPVLIWREGPTGEREGTEAGTETETSGRPQSRAKTQSRARRSETKGCETGEDAASTEATSADATGADATSENATSENEADEEGAPTGGDGAAVAEAPFSSSSFDLYSTVLSGLTQEELSQVSRTAVEGAISAAQETEGVPWPESATAAEAWAVARSALAKLRGGESEGQGSSGGQKDDGTSECDGSPEGSSFSEDSPGEDALREEESLGNDSPEYSGPSYDPTEKIT